MIATHRRIVREAECHQWNGNNTQEIVDFLGKHGMVGSLYRDKYLSVRADGFIVHTMWPGSLVIEGEDHEIRFYSDEKFRTMYRLIVPSRKLPYLPSLTDEELISYMEGIGGLSEAEVVLMERLKDALDRESDSETSVYLTPAELAERQGVLNSATRAMLDNVNINTTKGE